MFTIDDLNGEFVRKITTTVLSTMVLVSGCVTFPKDEARAKARDLRQKGYPSDADRLEQRAEDLPKHQITIGEDEYDPRNDAYHYPELQVPEEDRRKPKGELKPSEKTPALQRVKTNRSPDPKWKAAAFLGGILAVALVGMLAF